MKVLNERARKNESVSEKGRETELRFSRNDKTKKRTKTDENRQLGELVASRDHSAPCGRAAWRAKRAVLC